MVRTRVGYAGGSTPAPTYRSIGDHTEALQVDYDPRAISYEELLDVFWMHHSPTRPPWSRQYRSAVFAESSEQARIARESAERIASTIGGPVLTAIEPAGPFYRAEDYHQKYGLRHDRMLLREFEAMYPDPDAFTDSTAAAKVNGFVYGGCAGKLALERDIERLGLSPEGRRHLLEVAGGP